MATTFQSRFVLEGKRSVEFDAFVTEQRRRGLAETTIDARLRRLWAFRIHLGKPLVEATAGDVEQWLDGCNLAKSSRYVYVSCLAAYYRWAVRAGDLERAPTDDVVRPRLPRRVPRPMMQADFVHAVEQADPRMKCWLLLAGHQGLRCKEISGLRREAVLDDRDPPLLVVEAGKGSHEGVLPLNPEVEQALRNYGMPRRGWVFTMRNGRPYQPSTVSVYIGRFLRECGVEATAHRARHSYGTKVWAATKDMRVLQSMLRHADPRTSAMYAAFDDPLAVRAVRGLSYRSPLPVDSYYQGAREPPQNSEGSVTEVTDPNETAGSSEESVRRGG